MTGARAGRHDKRDVITIQILPQPEVVDSGHHLRTDRAQPAVRGGDGRERERTPRRAQREHVFAHVVLASCLVPVAHLDIVCVSLARCGTLAVAPSYATMNNGRQAKRGDDGRFLTPRMSSKSRSPRAMPRCSTALRKGDGMNLVIRRPTKAIEAKARSTLALDRDVGYDVFGLVGIRKDID